MFKPKNVCASVPAHTVLQSKEPAQRWLFHFVSQTENGDELPQGGMSFLHLRRLMHSAGVVEIAVVQ